MSHVSFAKEIRLRSLDHNLSSKKAYLRRRGKILPGGVRVRWFVGCQVGLYRHRAHERHSFGESRCYFACGIILARWQAILVVGTGPEADNDRKSRIAVAKSFPKQPAVA